MHYLDLQNLQEFMVVMATSPADGVSQVANLATLKMEHLFHLVVNTLGLGIRLKSLVHTINPLLT
jgi:hypothetical protein